jgi:protein-disulfide isomerase
MKDSRMHIRPLSVALGILLACVALAPACSAQPPTTGADTQKQIDALRVQVNAMQKDLDEIKALLAPLRSRQQAPSPASAVLDLGGRPVKGASAAKLVLVELTDYQ